MPSSSEALPRKRPAASAPAMASKRVRVGSPLHEAPTHIAQLVKTMKTTHDQVQQATDTWVRHKGGEDKMIDADAALLRILRLALLAGNVAMKLADTREEAAVKQEDQFEERLLKMRASLERRQDDKFQHMHYAIEGDIQNMAKEANEDLLDSWHFRDAMSEVIERHPEMVFDESWMEIKRFVTRQMKAAKDAPESSQDILREYEAEIGF